jgi:hypothetical protein
MSSRAPSSLRVCVSLGSKERCNVNACVLLAYGRLLPFSPLLRGVQCSFPGATTVVFNRLRLFCPLFTVAAYACRVRRIYTLFAGIPLLRFLSSFILTRQSVAFWISPLTGAYVDEINPPILQYTLI